MTTEQNPRGFEIRRIPVSQDVGCAGYGVEILDGGRGGYQNKLVLGRGLFGTTQAHPLDSEIPCTPGNRVISTFDYLRLKQDTVNDPSSTDSVLVKVHTTRTAVFVDTPAPGVVKKRWLARGSSTIAGSGVGAERIYKSSGTSSSTLSIVDDYHTEPQLDDRGYWCGWVQAEGAGFQVWILAAREDTDGAAIYRPVQVLAPHDFSASFPSAINSATRDPAFCVDFCTGTATTTTAGTSIPIPYPGGQVEVWVVNTGVPDLTIHYLLGVKGHS